MAFADAQTGGVVSEGVLPVRLTLAGTVSAGDLIGYATGWKRALATVATAIQGRFVAGEDGVSGDEITAFAGAVVKGRISGATPGNPIYSAEGTDNGEYTETAPSTQNDVNKILGYAIAADAIAVFPMMRADSLAP